MGRRVQVNFKNQIVAGDELTFEPINESWNEYACDDGATVKVRLVVSRITRLLNEKNEDGEPVYVVKVSSIVAVTPPAAQKP